LILISHFHVLPLRHGFHVGRRYVLPLKGARLPRARRRALIEAQLRDPPQLSAPGLFAFSRDRSSPPQLHAWSAVVRVNQDDAGLFERALNRFEEALPHLAPALEPPHRRGRHSGHAGEVGRAPSKSLPREPTLHRDNCSHGAKRAAAPRCVIVILSDGTASTSPAFPCSPCAQRKGPMRRAINAGAIKDCEFE
jgi:hypothetical protein